MGDCDVDSRPSPTSSTVVGAGVSISTKKELPCAVGSGFAYQDLQQQHRYPRKRRYENELLLHQKRESQGMERDGDQEPEPSSKNTLGQKIQEGKHGKMAPKLLEQEDEEQELDL